MMSEDERFDLTFDHAWDKMNTALYNETKRIAHQRWDGELQSGEFYFVVDLFFISCLAGVVSTPPTFHEKAWVMSESSYDTAGSIIDLFWLSGDHL